MADAKICDRCGGYYGANEDGDADDRELFITAERAASVVVKESDLHQDAIAAAAITERSATKSASVNTKDLCEDCYEAFLEYWNDGGDA